MSGNFDLDVADDLVCEECVGYTADRFDVIVVDGMAPVADRVDRSPLRRGCRVSRVRQRRPVAVQRRGRGACAGGVQARRLLRHSADSRRRTPHVHPRAIIQLGGGEHDDSARAEIRSELVTR